ncbi:MAG: nucleotidyltransferase family protein [Caldilineaceae bacterium]
MSVLLTLESRLILICTRTEPDLHQIQHLIDRGPDWQAIVRATEQWGVVSLVYTTLQAVAEIGNVPTAVMEQLRHTYRRDTIHSIAQRDLIGIILQRFVDAGVPAIVLPNVALATHVYPAPNLRPIGDIDLLIHAHDHARAEALLAAIQIERPSFPYLGPWGIHQVKLHEHLATARGAATGSATAVYPPPAEVWPRAQPAVIESVPTLVLSHADLLLQLALQLAEAPHANGHVRTLCDIAETCRCYTDAIDWEHLATLAERYQATQQLRAALSVALELVGAAVPSLIVTGWHLAHTGQPALLRISTQLSEQPASMSPPTGTPLAARAAPPEPPPTAAPQARVEPAKATDAQGQLAVTYDQHGASDGVGAQLQRIYGLFALARTLNIKYVHTPLAQVRYQGFLSLLSQTPDPDFVERYNAFFTLPSDDFDLAGCERIKIHNLDLETVERYRAQAATGRPILLETLMPFAYTDRYPAAYRTLHAVSPYREHRPTGPVRVCIHLRRGDNLPDSRRRWLPNEYYLRVCEQILGALQRHGVPFTVRLHSELPDRRYALYPKFPGLYFELEQPVIIDPEEYALEEFDVLPNLEMVLNAEPLDAIHDFATADVLILSASSFGYFGGMLNPHGVTVFAPFTWNKPLPDWLIADAQGNLNEDEVAAKIADLLQRRG